MTEPQNESSTPNGTSEQPAEEPPVAADEVSAAAPPEPSEPDGEEADVVEMVPEPDEREQLQAELDEVRGRLRTVSKAYTDLQNEMSAFRKRVEAQARYKETRRGFDAVKAFFDPVQNLQRSLEAQGEGLEDLRSGLHMVHGQFMDALDKLGLEAVPGEGARFDPNVHEALALMPVTQANQDGVILQVCVGGYMLDGKALQAAQVIVGKHEAPVEVSDDDTEVVLDDGSSDESAIEE